MARRPVAAWSGALALSWWVARAQGDYPKGLLTISGEAEEARFLAANMEPRHAVVLAVAGRGSKRHRLLEELASDEDLQHLAAFGVRFSKRNSSLAVALHAYPSRTYEGKWIRSHVRKWLLHAAFPPVNRVQYQFAPPKYLMNAVFGTVLVAKGIGEPRGELVTTLERFADEYRDTLKFTFFPKAEGTRKLCEMYGVWTNDELLLLERPRETRAPNRHSSAPPPPKYRLENVTPARVEEFFAAYAAGTWPLYYKAATERSGAPIVGSDGVRELSSWDFAETVADPTAAVLVVFVSRDCEACDEFADAYRQIAKRAELARSKPGASAFLRHLIVARMDQANEHSERIKGTPWLRFWPRGSNKRPFDVELRSVDSIWEFLEDQAADEAEEEAKKGRRIAAAAAAGALDAGVAGGSCRQPGPDGTCAAACGGAGAGSGTARAGARSGASAGAPALGRPNPEAAKGYLAGSVDPEDLAE